MEKDKDTTLFKENHQDKENITSYNNMKTILKFGNNPIGSTFTKVGGSMPKAFKIMSDEEAALIKSSKGKVDSEPGKVMKRKSLATLQLSTQGKGALAGQHRESLSIKDSFKKKKEKSIKKEKKSAIIETISESNTESCSSEDTDNLINDAITLMKATEKVDDTYWKSLAEDRRIALEESLQENEKLYDEIDALEIENNKLKQDVSNNECYKLLYTNLLAHTDVQSGNNREVLI